jgi:hypothetical protein
MEASSLGLELGFALYLCPLALIDGIWVLKRVVYH